ncbi:MAG: LysM peptidoglycan-binding domain-containing protein [Verrucomicrobiota bacterium]
MKLALWIFSSCALAVSLSSCGSNSSPGNPQAVTGPYDKNGNYIEEWADNPSKWRKSGGSPSPHEQRTDELPEIARNEQPPQNSVPLVTSAPSKPAPVIAQTQVKQPSSQPKTTVRKSEPVVVKAKPKAKPKTVVKAKPKSTRYVVKKGDSLSAIASRTGSSVSAIKSANGISGTLIRPGQSLTIPRK